MKWLVIGFLCWWGALEGSAAWTMAKSYQAIGRAPLVALQLNLKAHKRFPYDARYRRQLGLSLASVTRAYWPDVRLSKDASDRIYRISASSGPDNPAVLLARAEVLINFGRADEAQPLFDRLNATHPHQVNKLRILQWRN